MSREIPLTRGLVTIVDDEDFDWLSQWKWHRQSSGYAARGVTLRHADGSPKKSLELMHRAILQPPTGIYVDHVNANKLDNRRHNLRLADPSQSCANRPNATRSATGFRGVYLVRGGKFCARVWWRRRCYGGPFRGQAHEAAQDYDRLAREHFGPFAVTNFAVNPSQPDPPRA